jgi:hypothetical protein
MVRLDQAPPPNSAHTSASTASSQMTMKAIMARARW